MALKGNIDQIRTMARQPKNASRACRAPLGLIDRVRYKSFLIRSLATCPALV
jgi:hypothetical protein